MINIDNPQIFGKVIADAVIAIDGNATLQAWEKQRYLNAVAKASARMQELAYSSFMEFNGDADEMLIWSDKSNQIYTVRGYHECQCRAAESNNYCWHKAAKRLYENYLIAAAKAAFEKQERISHNRKSFGWETEVSIREVQA